MGKEYGFLVYSCSYHKLGDLSTTLEMTVIFSIVIQSVSEESPGKAPIYGEVCVASEVFLRKVKFVYDK